MLKFNASAAACTLMRVASDTCSGCAKVRDTVALDTPAFECYVADTRLHGASE